MQTMLFTGIGGRLDRHSISAETDALDAAAREAHLDQQADATGRLRIRGERHGRLRQRQKQREPDKTEAVEEVHGGAILAPSRAPAPSN